MPSDARPSRTAARCVPSACRCGRYRCARPRTRRSRNAGRGSAHGSWRRFQGTSLPSYQRLPSRWSKGITSAMTSSFTAGFAAVAGLARHSGCLVIVQVLAVTWRARKPQGRQGHYDTATGNSSHDRLPSPRWTIRICWWWTTTSGCAPCCSAICPPTAFASAPPPDAAEARALMKSMAFDLSDPGRDDAGRIRPRSDRKRAQPIRRFRS